MHNHTRQAINITKMLHVPAKNIPVPISHLVSQGILFLFPEVHHLKKSLLSGQLYIFLYLKQNKLYICCLKFLKLRKTTPIDTASCK